MQSQDDQIQVIGNLKNISMASSKLLLAAKSLSVDPGAANAKNLLAVAARYDKMQKTPDVDQIFSVSNEYDTVSACKLSLFCPKCESWSRFRPVESYKKFQFYT